MTKIVGLFAVTTLALVAATLLGIDGFGQVVIGTGAGLGYLVVQ